MRLFKGFCKVIKAASAQPSSARGRRASGKPIYTRETLGQKPISSRPARRTGARAAVFDEVRKAKWSQSSEATAKAGRPPLIAIDAAFESRISRCFDSLCDNFLRNRNR